MYKVLVIDDNELIGKMVQQYLQQFDYVVDVTQSPFGVINKVREFKPNAVLLDINMPGLRGDKLARLINDHRDALGDFMLIAFSSEDEVVQRELVENSMVDGYILKTNSVNGLEQRLKEFGTPVRSATA
jgi:DNA-binding response OmpR family regulator